MSYSFVMRNLLSLTIPLPPRSSMFVCSPTPPPPRKRNHQSLKKALNKRRRKGWIVFYAIRLQFFSKIVYLFTGKWRNLSRLVLPRVQSAFENTSIRLKMFLQCIWGERQISKFSLHMFLFEKGSYVWILTELCFFSLRANIIDLFM